MNNLVDNTNRAWEQLNVDCDEQFSEIVEIIDGEEMVFVVSRDILDIVTYEVNDDNEQCEF